MASNLVMNGTTYDGTPVSNPTHPRKPSGLTYREDKIGEVQIAASGKRTWVQRLDGSSNPIIKHTWEVSWELANEVTRSAVRALDSLTTTWAFVDQLGTSRTVQTEPGDYEEDYALTDVSGNLRYNLKLTIREV